MNTNTFWILALRITGIIIVVFGVDRILDMFNVLIDLRNDLTFELTMLFILSIAFYAIILVGFVISPELIIRVLKLTKGVEYMELKLDQKSEYYLKMVVLIVGGILLLTNLVDLITVLIGFLQFEGMWQHNPLLSELVKIVLKIGLGYVLVFHSNLLVKFLRDKLHEDERILDNNAQPDN